MAATGSIAVAVRVRPPNTWEAARLPDPYFDAGIRTDGALSTPGRSAISTSCLREVVKVVDDRILMFDPDEKDRAKAFAERGFVPPGTKRYKDKRFMFDRVFDADARQIDVYEATARPLLDRLLDGYNATVFAYGATGCGKTHTISGTDTDPGLIYLTMSDLFHKIEERRSENNIDIYVTFLEIYNEEIRDLLAEPGTPTPRGGLQIREDKSVKVVGLVELHPTSADQIKEIVLLGNSRRTQSPTNANETSSRSHAVLQVHVSSSPRTASTTEQRTMATLSIIDLAGSERAAATTNMGQRMVEGANINKSLLALGNCINALCESGGATRHIPYRNSKLTRLLKFSLGGNCKTVMIVCIAPASNHFDDTHNTLLYADRASKIRTKVVTRNVVNVDRHVGQYVEAINRLNLEVAELKAKLAGKVNGEAEISRRKKEQAKAEVDRSRDDIERKAEQTRPSIIAGSRCEAVLSVARAKIEAYARRLTQIRAQLATSSSTPDLAAEQTLLESLISSEEAQLHPSSEPQVQLTRSQNANSMFEAMLRAVTERRSDRLDELSIENVRLDALYRKTHMDFLKAEALRDALQASVSAQSELITNLVSVVTRCTMMLEDGSKALRQAAQETDRLAGKAENISSSLHHLAEANNTTFGALFGRNIDPSLSDGLALLATGGKISYISPVLNSESASSQTQGKPARRVSSAHLSIPDSSSRRFHRSPRKSLRSSLLSSGLHARRHSLRPQEKKKAVQWKDEAGQGSLVDGGDGSSKDPSLIIDSHPNSQTSECDWEDEKTDDSSGSSFSGLPARDVSSSRAGPRRPSRLDPSFLKARSASSSLGSVVEDDESKASQPLSSSGPFTNRLVNLPSPPDSSIASSSSVTGLETAKRKREESPSTDGPNETKTSDSGARRDIGNGRRRSSIGPLRSEKRRRSGGLLPPPDREVENSSATSTRTGPRRVPIVHTPAKRVKRNSLFHGRTPLSVRSSLQSRPKISLPPSDANNSGDISLKATRPTWR
ncbi:kinesin-domain-containing protein [Fomitiporia mediterranea MF3/22]|uniref:kinesin-domain-containing protein n=1 Tax=Fomitiporia mediterranea (strain MF3/22) TaxID=694068 RepID=UPI0004408D4D|nr:kinesin-domain-containing protein [Fomitiporia mediterranea MF3/22]EJD01192.1 kinesin-domain-containing protein [Fomitiporia mediterranea MF3/22]